MSIVLDTNVLVAGLLNPFGSPGRILDLILNGDLILAYDDRILAEYRDVLGREKFGFNPAHVGDLLAYLQATGQHVTAVSVHVTLPDPDDLPFLEVTLAAQAEALITGNVRHYPVEARQGAVVLTPDEIADR